VLAKAVLQVLLPVLLCVAVWRGIVAFRAGRWAIMAASMVLVMASLMALAQWFP
jgi:hypothetical protein